MSRFVLTMGWNDVPHLSEAQKEMMLAALPPFQRDARSRGIPQLGSGSIFPVPESDFAVTDFEIPAHWPRCFSLDVGWNRTAALWAAWDRDNDIVYLISEHYRGQAEPSIHAEAIKGRGAWIPGVIDPASRGRSQRDGFQLLDTYKELGLDIDVAFNGVESGLYEVWQRLSTGRLKVFKSLSNFFFEFRLYRRDEKGRIVKENDHLMDCLAPETIVITDNGPRRIIDLVGTTGRVLSIDGNYFDYTLCDKTRVNSEMVELKFEDGQNFKCTPDHKIMTDKGWVCAKDMLDRKAYSVGKEGDLCKLKPLQKLVRNIMVQGTTIVEITFREMEFAFIEKYGKIISEKFKRAFTFITSITTEITTQLKTLPWLDMKNTLVTTQKENQGSYLRRHSLKQQNGMGASRESNGIMSTIKKMVTNYTSVRNSNVYNVQKNLQKELLGKTNSAQATVRQNTGISQVLITRLGHAFTAKNLSSLINIKGKTAAREYVRVMSVGESNPSDTYCLKVPIARSFAVESGILVHNCSRYLIMSGLDRAKVKPNTTPQEKSKQHYSNSSGNWMG